jgi:hypothetical protein
MLCRNQKYNLLLITFLHPKVQKHLFNLHQRPHHLYKMKDILNNHQDFRNFFLNHKALYLHIHKILHYP